MISTKIVRCEIVPATYDPKKFEIKVFYGKDDWHYFSRGFGTRKDAQVVVNNLMGKRP
jgi:hypothetical protein